MLQDYSDRESTNKYCVQRDIPNRFKNLKPHENMIPWYTSGFQ